MCGGRERGGSSDDGLATDVVCTIIDNIRLVNGAAYMDFKEATDDLFDKVDHEDLAKALGVSVASIRQARLKAEASARRAPPRDWQETVIRLAEQRIMHYRALIQGLQATIKS